MFKEKFPTVNDLDDKESIEYKNNYYKDNVNIIRTYLTNLDLQILNHTFIGKLFSCNKYDAKMNSELWVYTDLRYGLKSIFVPIDFFTLTETVLSLDCEVCGIFRVKNSVTTVEECISMLEEEIKNRTNFEDIRNRLAENFSVIDLTTAFKALVRNYEYSVIPDNFIDLIYKMGDIESKYDRMIVFHYFFVSLPKFNRYLLEATIYFLYLIHDIATKNGKDYNNNMNMEGISTVMMPNLLLKDIKNVSLNKVPILVKFMKEFILNFPLIVKLNPNYNNFK